MNWFFLALLAALIFAWVTIIDKLMVDRNFTDPFMYSLFIPLYSLVAATGFVVTAGGWQRLPLEAIGTALLAGVLLTGATSLYFISLNRGDASLVSAAAQSRPLFAVFWGVVILGEYLSPLAYSGIVIVVIATILLSLERDRLARTGVQLNALVPLMLLSNIFHSVSRLSLKLSLQKATPENAFFWEVIGSLLTTTLILILWPTGRSRMRTMLVQVRRSSFVGSGLNELCASVAGLLLAFALTSGTLAGVTTLYATQPLFIGPFIWLANQFRPGAVTSENWSAALVSRRAMIALLLIGIYLLQIA